MPLALRSRGINDRGPLAALVVGIFWLFGSNTVILWLYFGMGARYQIAFAPALVLLAAIGVLALEDWSQGRPRLRLGLRSAWSTLWAISIAYNLLTALSLRGDYETMRGFMECNAGHLDVAKEHLRSALWIRPTNPGAHAQLALISALERRFDEACYEYGVAVGLAPESAPLHCYYALCLGKLGRNAEAEREFKLALSLQPDNTIAAAGLQAIDNFRRNSPKPAP